MSKIIDKQALLSRLDFLEVLQDLIPGGIVKGKEYHHLCLFHDDHRTGNASSSVATGHGKCLSCGASWDIFKLYMHITSTTSFHEILQAMAERYTGAAAPAPRQATLKPTPPVKDDGLVIVMPIPDEAPPFPAAQSHYGKPTTQWAYHDQAGGMLGYVCRFDRPGKRKEIMPLTFWKDGKGQHVWKWRHFPEPRPLYGLDRLATVSNSAPPGDTITILIVEGEKAADAAHDLVGDKYACISWPAGSNATHKADFAPCRQAHCIIWPDSDEPGIKAAQALVDLLTKAGAVSVEIITPPTDKPEGWDLADAKAEGWTAQQVIDHIATAGNQDQCQKSPELDPATSTLSDDTVDQTPVNQGTESVNEVVARLAALPPIQYDLVRKSEAKRLGVRPMALDQAVKEARKNGGANNDLPFDEVDPWPDPIDPARLLDDIAAAIRRFIVCDKEISNAVALWAAMTWFIDVIQVAPLAVITAPEKRCGKSQLLFLLGRLTAKAITASSISPAALFRTIDAWGPTLLIDEVDALLKDNEELRGLINSGHTRDSAYVIRTVGESFTPTKFNTWGAKALAGIGHVADTLMDRAVILELRRKLPHEQVDRIRYAEPGLFDGLRSKLARFADDYSAQVRQARPYLPPSLNDRAQDNWEPLLAIAQVAGGDWLEIGTKAALKLSGSESAPQTIGIELLADIKEVFELKAVERISTVELIKALCDDDEKPWATYNRGEKIKPRQLSKKLSGYGLTSKPIRMSSIEVVKGYEKNQFSDSFLRYLASPPLCNGYTVTNQQRRAVICNR